jgi:hypothetical protein
MIYILWFRINIYINALINGNYWCVKYILIFYIYLLLTVKKRKLKWKFNVRPLNENISPIDLSEKLKKA